MPGMDIRRPMMRCTRCRAWQSIHPKDVGDAACGGCGGELEEIDMQAHVAATPRATRTCSHCGVTFECPSAADATVCPTCAPPKAA